MEYIISISISILCLAIYAIIFSIIIKRKITLLIKDAEVRMQANMELLLKKFKNNHGLAGGLYNNILFTGSAKNYIGETYDINILNVIKILANFMGLNLKFIPENTTKSEITFEKIEPVVIDDKKHKDK